MIIKKNISAPFKSFIISISVFVFSVASVYAAWEPPTKVSKEEMVKISQTVLAMPEIKIKKSRK